MGGKIIGVISLKGGVGKTSSVSNLGASLARDFGQKVLIVDANFMAPNLGLHLGLIDPSVTIHDVLLNKANIDEAIYEHKEGFHLVPGSLLSKKVKSHRLKDKISGLKENYDVILLDSSPNLNEEILATMMASDELLVVTSPDFPTLSTTLRAVRLAAQKKVPISGLLVNRVRNKNFELSLEDIEQAAKVSVLSVVQEDMRVPESIYHTTPVAIHKPWSKSARGYRKLAARLIGQEYKENMMDRLKGIFLG